MCISCFTDPDCQNHRVEVMISHYCRGKPGTEHNWAKYNKSFQLKSMSARDLAIEIYKGWSFCPPFKERRIKSRFTHAWHIALDFDTEDKRSSLDYLFAQDVIQWFASFGYTSPSHTAETPRARIVWVFPEPITDINQYEELYQALLWELPWADKSAKDALRLFFGSPKCDVWSNWSIFPSDARQFFINRYQRQKPKPAPRTTKPVEAEEVSDGYIDKLRTGLLSSLASAQDGEKHKKLYAIAFTFGGYIASGYFEEGDIRNRLVRVVDDKMSNVDNYRSAYKTIDDGLADGQSKPLKIERSSYAGEVI